VDAPVKLAAALLALLCVLGTLALLVAAPPARAAGPAALVPAASSGATPIKGNVSGPSLVATSGNATFYFNVSGGPAYVSGTFVGQFTWTAKLSGANLTSSSVSPDNGTLVNTTSQPVSTVVTVGPHPESLTLVVSVTSTLAGNNSTANLTRSFRSVTPYTVRATLVAGAKAAVLPFGVTVTLDGTVVGQVSVPELAAKSTYDLVYRYASLGLSAGYHTFTLTISNAHGLVAFSNGRTVLTTTFYVGAAPTNNIVWYVLGAVTFIAVLFIYATRVAARRRGAVRR